MPSGRLEERISKRFLAPAMMFAVMILAAGCAHVAASAKSGGPHINWHTLAAGRELAMREKKPMVVDFASGPGCPRCEQMSAGPYSNAEVISELNREFVPIRIDLSRPITPGELALGNRFNFRNDCLLLFLDYRGNPIADPIEGKLCFVEAVNSKDFLKYLDAALKNAKEVK